MRIISRLIATGMFAALIMGVVGCGENNQSVVDKQASSGTVATKSANVSDQKAFFEQQKKTNSLKQSGYPGAK